MIELDSVVGKGGMGALRMIWLNIKAAYWTLRSDAVYGWFADYQTMIPTVLCYALGKQSFMTIAGFDVGYLPELNYGARMRPFRWFCVRMTLKFATHLFAVSNYTAGQVEAAQPKRHGKMSTVYLCSDPTQYPADVAIERSACTITVSQGDNWTEYVRKGSDRFIEAARITPSVQFYLVGLRGEAFDLAERDGKGVENLTLIKGPVDFTTGIVPLYMKCASYCQLSVEEAGATAVTETILAGMFPVVWSGSGMTELVGDYGAVVSSIEEVSRAVTTATTVDRAYREGLRTLGERYTVEARAARVLGLIQDA